VIYDHCVICGCTDELHHHHIIPKSKGGSDDETNMITLCTTHHAWIHGLNPTTWNNHGKLVKEGMERSRAAGNRIGRPSALSKQKKKEVLLARKRGMSYGKIAIKFGIGKTTAHRMCNETNQ